MAVSGQPSYVFFSWVRQGLASAIAAPGAGQPLGTATVTPSLVADGEAAQAHLRLYGPGDVRGLDPRVVSRTDPGAGADDFEPNHLAMVELSRADLPWLFTPAPAVGQRLQPWICLVVVPRSAADGPGPSPPGPLPVLTVDASELPSLDDAAAAAHAQVTVLPGQQPQDLVAAGSPAAVSRLLSFRNLRPRTRYVACVVPTFALGVIAGLGQEPTAQDEQQLAPAWTAATTGPVRLPVYHSWEFTTGDAGDFASLASLLEHRAPGLGPALGHRPMDVSRPGYGLPGAGGPLGLPGAVAAAGPLVPAGQAPPPGPAADDWSGAAHDAFQAALRALLNRTAAAATPLVAPPIHGAWPSGQAAVPMPGAAPAWLAELNLDPRHRVAAGLGAAVVHREQELLMAAAWDQLAHLRQANQALRQAQLASAVASAVHRAHIVPLADAAAPGRLLQVTRPLHSRALVGGVTVTGYIATRALPAGAVSPALRRLASPQGPLARRLTAGGGALPSMIDRLARGQVALAPARAEPAGTVLGGAVTAAAGAAFADVALAGVTAAALQAQVPTAPGWHLAAAPAAPATRAMAARSGGRVDWYDPADGGIPAPPGFDGLTAVQFLAMKRSFADAAGRHQAYLAELARLPGDPAPPPLIDLTAQQVLAQLDPAPAVLAAARDRLGLEPPAQLDPLSEAPRFPQAAIEPLVGLSPEHVLPGLDGVPDDSVVLMQPDYRFIESYMVGLNQEMARELVWRGFPTPRRATFFHRFWSSSPDRGDIPDIASWNGGLALGANAAAWAAAPLPLLVRGRLLRRYPSASIYLQAAVPQGSGRAPGGAVREPVFRASLGADVVLLGFDVALADVLGDTRHPQGWFVVIEQHSQEPGFGLAAPNGHNVPPATWDQISWSSLVASDAALAGLRYASMAWGGGALALPLAQGGPTLTWGADAAQMASICLRSPVRVAIHASLLLAPGG